MGRALGFNPGAMANDLVYLRPNAVLEPLVDQWYAWAHLIPPATAARNLTHRHLPIMESFLAAPEIHQAAVGNPSLIGGPFMNVAPERAGEVAALRERTLARRAPLIAFSRALDELDRLLRAADGSSLEPLYAQVPAPLDGCVELVYDLGNRASFRLIEPLLYRSELHDPSAQTVWLSLAESDRRPFVLSTPRLVDERDLHLEVPFAHPGLDLLFRSGRAGVRLGELREALGWPDALDGRMRDLFAPRPPPPADRFEGPGVRLRYFGHACVLVETEAVSVLLDPLISYRYPAQPARYTYEDLPGRIDYVLVTHGHQDHTLLEALLRLRHRAGCVVVPRSGRGALQDPSLRWMLQGAGFPRVVELGELEELPFDGGSIMGVPFLGEHGDLDAAKLAFRIEAGGRRLMFAADSRNVAPALYRRLHQAIGDVDVLFIGMECEGAPVSWIYGPLYSTPLSRSKDASRRLSGSDDALARELAQALRCRQVYVYAMGQEPWLEHLVAKRYTSTSTPIVASDRFVAECGRAGISCERLFAQKTALL